jgi:8-oxo-dGTP pyrophosphatase MutT (NUDIX family)
MGKAPEKETTKVGVAAKSSRDPVQIAALPYQIVDGEMRILLVTSRGTRRWIIPKGWPMKGKKPHRAAELEAQEEAGAKGRIARRPFGQYEAWKRLTDHFVLCTVDVYPLQVRRQRKRWLEQSERHAAWFSALDAADLVEEPGLRALILDFHRTRQSESQVA